MKNYEEKLVKEIFEYTFQQFSEICGNIRDERMELTNMNRNLQQIQKNMEKDQNEQ